MTTPTSSSLPEEFKYFNLLPGDIQKRILSYLPKKDLGSADALNVAFRVLLKSPVIWVEVGKQLGLTIKPGDPNAKNIVLDFCHKKKVSECAMKCLPDAFQKGLSGKVSENDIHAEIAKFMGRPDLDFQTHTEINKKFRDLIKKVVQDSGPNAGPNPIEVDAVIMLINDGIMTGSGKDDWEIVLRRALGFTGEKNLDHGDQRIFEALAKKLMQTVVPGLTAAHPNLTEAEKGAILGQWISTILMFDSPNDFLRVIMQAGHKPTDWQIHNALEYCPISQWAQPDMPLHVLLKGATAEERNQHLTTAGKWLSEANTEIQQCLNIVDEEVINQILMSFDQEKRFSKLAKRVGEKLFKVECWPFVEHIIKERTESDAKAKDSKKVLDKNTVRSKCFELIEKNEKNTLNNFDQFVLQNGIDKELAVKGKKALQNYYGFIRENINAGLDALDKKTSDVKKAATTNVAPAGKAAATPEYPVKKSEPDSKSEK